MTRRLWLCVILLILAVPSFAARRRTITPGDPDHCIHATLAEFFSSASLLAVDEQHVYIVSGPGSIVRIPKLGGEIELLVFSIGDWLALSMAIDATNIYLGAIPGDGFLTKEPGAILTVPKSGGVPEVLVDEVKTPFSIAVDATHVYWAAAGTLDLIAQRIESDGKIERAQKNGSNRQALAEDLSGPLAVAVDANDVFFSETGFADDDPTTGLYRVAKSGGATTELGDEIGAILITVDGNTIVFFGGNETEGGIAAIGKDGATPMRVLYPGEEGVDETVGVSLRVADRRAYFVREKDVPGATGELAWVNIDAPNGLVVVRNGLYFEDDFALDGCAAIVSTTAGQLIRTAR